MELVRQAALCHNAKLVRIVLGPHNSDFKHFEGVFVRYKKILCIKWLKGPLGYHPVYQIILEYEDHIALNAYASDEPTHKENIWAASSMDIELCPASNQHKQYHLSDYPIFELAAIRAVEEHQSFW